VVKKIRVGVLFGGQSGEHEVSLASAKSILRALESTGKYDVVPIGITRAGRWLIRADALPLLASRAEVRLTGSPDAAAGAEGEEEEPTALLPDGGENSLVRLTPSGGAPETIDVVFPVLHGPKGEDGAVQGFLELAGIPYVGSGVAASAAGMDKDMMKRLFRDAGLPTPDWIVIDAHRYAKEKCAFLERAEAIGYPVFVKPANLGSSVGISKAHGRNELESGIEDALQYDTKILVERGIDAREIECAVLGNDEPEASVPGEVIPSREFYDYDAKYIDEGSKLVIPAPIDERAAREIRRISVLAFQVVGCAGMARGDFLLERDTNRIFLNELNTIPGFTNISMYPKLWEASGVSYVELVDRLVRLAMERHETRKNLSLSHKPRRP